MSHTPCREQAKNEYKDGLLRTRVSTYSFDHTTGAVLQRPRGTDLCVVRLCPVDLVLVDGDAGDVRAADGGDGAHGAAHAAAAV